MNSRLSTYHIKAYFKFLWQSTNQHGVHSPFVFQLVTRCFYDRKTHPGYRELTAQRRSLLQNPQMREVEHVGMKAEKGMPKTYQASEIVRASGFSLARGQLLNRLIRYLQINRALELGNSLGLEAAAMVTHNSVAVTSIQDSPITAKTSDENLKSWGIGQVVVQTTKTDYMSEGLHFEEFQHQDLVYVHRSYWQENLRRNFLELLPLAHNDSVFIFDGIHCSPQMTETWNTIKGHPQVRVSIDTFRCGFVFFRTEQAKEDFVIRV